MDLLKMFIPVLLVAILFACDNSSPRQFTNLPEHSTVPDTCDDHERNLECCFVSMPASVNDVMVMASVKEPGEKLVLKGTIFEKDGKTPADGVILYAYQTDITGHYTKSGNETGPQKFHGRLHGWCRTNANGNYEIRTIRPASYPKSSEPAHIHVIVKLPSGESPFYISDFVFSDDPFVTEQYRPYSSHKMRGSGIIELTKKENVWYGTREMVMTD